MNRSRGSNAWQGLARVRAGTLLMAVLVLAACHTQSGDQQAATAKRPNILLHPGRRSGLRRHRCLRRRDSHAEPGPAGTRGHAADRLLREHDLLADALDGDVGHGQPSGGPRRDGCAARASDQKGQPGYEGYLNFRVATLARAAGGRGLQHLHGRQVAPQRRRQGRDRAACARLQARVRIVRWRRAPGRLGLARTAARQLLGWRQGRARGRRLVHHARLHQEDDRLHRAGSRRGQAVLRLHGLHRAALAVAGAEGIHREVQGLVRRRLRSAVREALGAPEGTGPGAEGCAAHRQRPLQAALERADGRREEGRGAAHGNLRGDGQRPGYATWARSSPT